MITLRPKAILKTIAPKTKIRRLVKQESLTLNVTVLGLLADNDFISKARLFDVAINVARHYKTRYKENDLSRKEILGDKKLMVARVQNAVISEVSQEVKRTYKGEFYRWLESESDNPDPDHQKNYGHIFQVGIGEMPGERFGCRCGMQILVNETKLDI